MDIDELAKEQLTGINSDELDGELEDFFENDILIIPIFKREEGRCLMFTVEMRPENILVKLYAKKTAQVEDDEYGKTLL